MHYLKLAAAAAVAIFLSAPLISQQANKAPARRPALPDWQLSVGAGSLVNPIFEGSDDYGLSLLPNVRLTYKDRFFASIPEGIGYALYAEDGLKAGPLVKIRFGRDEDQGGSPFILAGSTDALAGLGDIGAAGEAGAFFDYTRGRWNTRLELRQGFGGHEGFIGELTVRYSGRAAGWLYNIGPRIRYTSGDFVDTYFGVSPLQSLNSGLAQFNGGSGFNSFGAGGTFIRPFDRGKWSIIGLVGYDRLTGDIADSPLVQDLGSRNQFSVGIFLNRTFGWN